MDASNQPKMISILTTGRANLASVQASFHRLEAHTRLISTAQEIEEASFLVLPGVGAFKPAYQRLAEDGLIQAIQKHGRREKRDSRLPRVCFRAIRVIGSRKHT